MFIKIVKYTTCTILAFSLWACANAGVGISIPVGPFGSVGIGMNSQGQVSGTVGVGTSVGGVGIGAGTSFPISNPQQNTPQTQQVAPQPNSQTAPSTGQNVPASKS